MSNSKRWNESEMPSRPEVELERCRRCLTRTVRRHCRILNEAGDWIPFDLWPAQARALQGAEANRLVVWLKARQLGMTWLALGLALHTLLFRPGVTVLLFSLRDEESMELLKRLKGMYRRLPDWLRPPRCGDPAPTRRQDAAHEWVLPNGSRAKAFPANRGDSYTAALAVVDEADLIHDLDRLLGSVKPTVDAGGRLLLLSRADKSRPESPFKRIYRAAREGANGWHAEFLPWHARPDRDAGWYAAQQRDVQARTGSLDALHEQYPATDTEALSPRTLDKRIAAAWLEQCYRAGAVPLLAIGSGVKGLPGEGCPALPGLRVWAEPVAGRGYAIGIDPAEGNPTSDDSALCVLDEEGGQVAELSGKIDPDTLAYDADRLGHYFNRAALMVERNNHGHRVLGWLQSHSRLRVLDGPDGKPGWLSNAAGKVRLYDTAAEAFRDGRTVLRSFAAYAQLASIEGNTLRAPAGCNDDLADAYALALAAVPQCKRRRGWRLETFDVES